MRTAQVLAMAGLLCSALARADNAAPGGVWSVRPLPAQEGSVFQEFRQRRLERALSEGKLTPEEAETLRRRWREEPAGQPLERLTPEQREQLRQFAEQRRRDRQELHDSLSPEQRETLHRLRQNGTLDRQQLFNVLTPEQRQQLLQRETQRNQERRRLLHDPDFPLQNPRRPFVPRQE